MMIVKLSDADGQMGKEIPFRFEIAAENIDTASENFVFEGKVDVKGTVVNTGWVYRFQGRITCTKAFDCDRCLEHTIQQQEHEFREDFVRGKDPETEGENKDLVNYFDGDVVDIFDLVRDTMLAAQPLNNICNADCRGLCWKCGANLNRGDCGCDRFVVDPRLAALQQLLDKE